MDYMVVEARYVSGYTIWLRFRDRSAGEIDLGPELHGEVFEPLRDLRVFRDFRVEGGALEWADGASFAPEFLHDRIRVTT
jgi:hypothetical protein